MQQRRLRLGDILDDYCPRERRITNHVVVAMIDDQVKQTRCSTCDADHEYRAAKGPPSRKKRPVADVGDTADGLLRPPKATGEAEPLEEPTVDDGTSDSHETPPPSDDPIAEVEPEVAAEPDVDDGPVHRRLIRATLPRQEGQSPERRAPDFTVRQPGGRGGREANGNKAKQRFGQGRKQGQSPGGGPRHSSGGSGGQRNSSGAGGGDNPGGPRGNRPGQGSGRGGSRRRGR